LNQLEQILLHTVASISNIVETSFSVRSFSVRIGRASR